MSDYKHIAAVFNHGVSFNRDVLLGVGDYARQKENWVLVPIAAEPRALSTARCQACDGLIGHLFSPALVDEVLKLGVPAVTVSGVLPEAPIPRVSCDHDAVGCLAAEHLLERGHRHFAFIGYRDFDFSTGRHAGFLRRLEEEGMTAESFLFRERLTVSHGGSLLTTGKRLMNWLASRPHPLAVFAANAVIGFRTSSACHEAGIRIPDDLALVSVDYDQLQSQLCIPPNSCVALPTHRMGYEGAKLLDELISGRKPQVTKIVLPPLGVVVQQSSDSLAIDDEDIAMATQFIRKHVSSHLNADDVVRHVEVSRRTLERKFRTRLGRGVAEEIRRTRRDRAKMLLASSEISIAQVATMSGYSGNIELAADFRKNVKVTPTEYRQRFRWQGH